MSKLDSILTRAGLDTLIPLIPTLTAQGLSEKIIEATGVVIHPDTILNLRKAERTYSGRNLERRFEAADLLGRDDATNKKNTLIAITSLGQTLRTTKAPPNHHLWLSDGYTSQIADTISAISDNYLKLLLRGMRTDLVLYTSRFPGSSVASVAINAFSNYLELTQRSTNPKTAKRIEKEWDGVTVRDFYEQVYSIAKRTVGVIVPWEVDVFNYLYASQVTGLTEMDQLVLYSIINFSKEYEQREVTAQQLAKSTGILVDSYVVSAWSSLMLSGTE